MVTWVMVKIFPHKNSLDPIKTLFTKIEWDFVVVVVVVVLKKNQVFR